MRRLALILGLLVTVGATAAPPRNETDARARLDAVRKEIHALAEAQRKAGGARDALVARLAEQADALAAAARAVRDSETELATQQTRLDELESARDAVQARLDAQREALAELLRAAYTLGYGSDLRSLLGQIVPCSGTDPGPDGCAPDDDLLAHVGRALAYSRYFQRDRLQRIRAISADLAELDSVRERIGAQHAALQAALDQQRQRQGQLEDERVRQQKLLAEAEAVIRDRGQRLQSLGEEEKSLQSLLGRLRDVFRDIPRDLAASTPFAKRRGQLPWPLTGNARSDNQGLLIAANPGTSVHAVAHGRVVYADWLRGYGMLLILDHGGGWMSLYGGNESLLREVGDWVDAGDAVATSGRGESGTPGLYFGLRHDGKPVDPRPWLRGKP